MTTSISMATKEEVIEALKTCFDPEIQMDVWTLGLIYDIGIADGKDVTITMTFTTPMCPYGPVLMDEIYRKVRNIESVNKVKIDITFDPPWKPSDELRAMLGI
jgi:metal-sulfur cluster biosynthetic enzyme